MPVSNNVMNDAANMFGSMNKMINTGQVDTNNPALNVPRTTGSQAAGNIGQQNTNDAISLANEGAQQAEALTAAQSLFGSATFTSTVVAGYWAMLKQIAKNLKEAGS